MKKAVLAVIAALPMTALGAGWDYYVLNDAGEWERISPYELNLTMPETGGEKRDGRHVMIIYDRRELKPREESSSKWLRQVDPDLVKAVK